jgi:hypothetical protein
VVDGSSEAAEQLAAGWGLGARRGEVGLQRRYDRITVTVPAWGLDLAVTDPRPIAGGDVQYVVGLHPVTTATGQPRLAQVEVDVALQRTERGRPVITSFDGIEVGERRLVAATPVAATVGAGTVTLPKLRFLLDPEQPPHLGTEIL